MEMINLDDWYGNAPFETLHKIFGTDNLFDLNESELEFELDLLREEWNDMSYEQKLYIYKLIENGND